VLADLVQGESNAKRFHVETVEDIEGLGTEPCGWSAAEHHLKVEESASILKRQIEGADSPCLFE
jgi:hypothetical protein